MMLEHDLFQFLTHNQTEMKRLCLPYKEQYDKIITQDENKDYLEIVKEQYQSLIKRTIVDEMSKMLGADAETANVFLDKINLLEYINL